MGVAWRARFEVDAAKCVRCGRCTNVCTGMVLHPGEDGVPPDHYMKLIVGFGYPEVPYARGVQKGQIKVHRWTEQSRGQLSML